MKVGVLTYNRPPELGGGYTFESDVLRSLVKLAYETDHEFSIFTNIYQDNSFESPHKDTNRIKFLRYPAYMETPWSLNRIIDALKLNSGLARLIWRNRNRLDRIAREAGIEVFWFLGANPILTDLPYLAMVWDLQHRLQPWFPEVSSAGIWDSRELFYCWFLQRACGIITGNEAGKAEVERFYQVPAQRIRTLPHFTPTFALNPPESDVDVIKKYDLAPNYLFYPAQFWAHKNHVNLLLAIRNLRDSAGLIFNAVFVGHDHGNLAHVKAVVRKLDLEQQVRFLGFVPREDLIGLYKNALALCYVSFFGPENLPPLEAFALGCPVLASHVEGATEQLVGAALLVDPKSPEEIAAAIRKMYEDAPLRETLRQCGYARARKWTADDFVKGVFAILDEFEPIRRCWK